MSPIILIHGNNSDGGFFARQGFTSGLDFQKLEYHNSITMATGPVGCHAFELNQRIPEIVRSYGVDSVHLIAHSKGGLDARRYLDRYQPTYDYAGTLKVLSLTTLDTPHNGSVLADVLEMRDKYLKVGTIVQYSGFPTFFTTLATYAPNNTGNPDLQTTRCAAFNAYNIPALPRTTVYNATGADADQNGNARIDSVPNEYSELLGEDVYFDALQSVSPQAARRVIDPLYQMLRKASAITVARVQQLTGRVVRVITTTPSTMPLGNDCLVTIPSALGTGSFALKTSNSMVFSGFAGKNHCSIANAGVSTTIGPWLIAIEKSNGDLK